MPANAEAVARTRQRIHQAAIGLFTRQGFHGTGMRQIAKEAEVSLGNLYNHHATKQELLGTILAEFEERYTAPDTPLARALASFESLADLETIGNASRKTVQQFSDYIRLIYVDVVELEGEHIKRLFGGMRKRYEQLLGARLEELRQQGKLGEDVDAIAGIMTATISFFYLFNIEHIFGVKRFYGTSDKEAIGTISTLLRDGMLPPVSLLWIVSPLILLAPNGLGLGNKAERATVPPAAPVTCLAVAPDAPRVFSGRGDGAVWVHEVETGAERVVGRLAGAVEGIASGLDGLVVAVDDQGNLAGIDLGGAEPRAIGRHESGALDVALSPDGLLVATAGTDGVIRLWSLQEERETARLDGHTGPVAALAWGPERLWSAGWDGTVRGWKVSASGRGKARGTWPAGRRELTALAAHPGEDRALSANWAGVVIAWRAKGAKAQQRPHPSREFQEVICAVAYDRTGERAVAVASAEKQLRVFAPADSSGRVQVLTQQREPSAAVFAPGQDALIVGFYDGRVLRLDIPAADKEAE